MSTACGPGAMLMIGPPMPASITCKQLHCIDLWIAPDCN